MNYYKKTNFKGHIFIVDSIEGEEKGKNSDNINKYAKDLFSVKYRKRVIKPKKGKGSFKRKKK